MIYLFSKKPGPLSDGAQFMKLKHAALHPADPAFYLASQSHPLHGCLGNLGPDSDFKNVDCRLNAGEAVIVIGHGGSDTNLYDEAGNDVTQAALRLMAKIAADNQDQRYRFFLAACGGGVRQPKQETSLLTTLVKATPPTADRLKNRTVECHAYTASAGLVDLGAGVPVNRQGTHIYGTLTDSQNVEHHCGYDCRITTQLFRLTNGTYLTIYFSPSLYPLSDVVSWAEKGFKPDMDQQFPLLLETVQPVQ
ncbi:hypothetical protein [Roseateles depolymerans]|uniref:Uncharacterized protein n=1 Tax=Roseateles depolymerans TaxID=76731 RepID=A0A0U3LFZ5_9BURK|nr:hypothetical protein [Roseateles depolymerans]ALV06991.1 hypothetical protein RD2015_2524 [Roseateles depolymerans]REG19972.1 hypothetical protein DES44_2478 [Roseateles depolymerans]